MENEAAPAKPATPAWVRFVAGRNPAWTLVRALVVIVTAIIVFKFILIPIRVTGESMSPTFRNGSIKFVNKLAYRKHPPKRGDIVAAQFEGRQILLLKRIIGLPGERFQVRMGDVYINGRKLEEPYANGRISALNGRGFGNMNAPVTLGPDEYMVIGDNRRDSEGYVKHASEIIGKVL